MAGINCFRRCQTWMHMLLVCNGLLCRLKISGLSAVIREPDHPPASTPRRPRTHQTLKVLLDFMKRHVPAFDLSSGIHNVLPAKYEWCFGDTCG